MKKYSTLKQKKTGMGKKMIFFLNQTFMNTAHAKRVAKNAINLYNQVRLHLSLNFKTPDMVYKLTA